MSRNRLFFKLNILVIGLALMSSTVLSQDPSASSAAMPKTAPTPSQDPTTSAPRPAQSPEKKKPKKVWTNDELGSVKGGISVVGDGNLSTETSSISGASTTARSRSLHQQKLDYYRNQLMQLQAQIDAADKRISQLKDFKAENTSASGGIKMHQGYNMVPVEEQVKQLESNKKELQAKIDDVENEARKNGIEPGELR